MTQATRSNLMSVATTLAANIDATQDYIPVASTTNFSTSVVAEVESTNEVVSFDSITTNSTLYSQDLTNAYWNKRGNASVTANDAVAPDGTTTATKVQGIESASTGDIYSYAVLSPAEGARQYQPSFYIKRISTSGTLNIANPNGPSLGDINVNLALLGDDWQRISTLSTQAAVSVPTATWLTNAGSVSGIHFRNASAGALEFYLWGIQLEYGTSVTGYLPTTSATLSGLTTVTRGANGTTAASASSGDDIQQLPYALLNVDMPVRLKGLSVSSDGTGAGRLTLCDKVGTHLCDVDIPDTKIFDLTFDGGILFPNGIYVANSDNITAYTLYTSGYNSPNLTAGG